MKILSPGTQNHNKSNVFSVVYNCDNVLVYTPIDGTEIIVQANPVVGTVAVTYLDNVNQVEHLSKTHLNMLEMYEISFVDAVMSRAMKCYQKMYMGAPK